MAGMGAKPEAADLEHELLLSAETSHSPKSEQPAGFEPWPIFVTATGSSDRPGSGPWSRQGIGVITWRTMRRLAAGGGGPPSNFVAARLAA